jgi:hypothetical protein
VKPCVSAYIVGATTLKIFNFFITFSFFCRRLPLKFVHYELSGEFVNYL